MKKAWFNNLTFIITGASSGIGLNLTKQLINNYGCKVLGVGRNENKLIALKDSFGDSFDYFSFDVSVKDNWNEFYNYLQTSKLKPSIIINNAGFFPKVEKTINSESTVNLALNINFFPSVYSLKLLPLLKANGKCGIVNISSSAALATIIGTSAYSASKSALKSWTEALMLEEKDTFVSCVFPGVSNTNLFDKQITEKKETRLFNKFALSPDICAKKILKRLARKKRHIVVGADAYFMNALYTHMPVKSNKLLAWIIKKAKLEMFEDIFDN